MGGQIMNNSIFVIKPYKWEGLWVFDDPNVGLVKEPFVGGADTMIDRATAHIPDATRDSWPSSRRATFPMPRSFWNGSRRRRQRLLLEGKEARGLALPGTAALLPRATGEAVHPGQIG
jgi:hypothetical protein